MRDQETLFRGLVDGLLVTTSWVEKVQSELGLAGASQGWAGRPCWFLWLARPRPTAYGLELGESSASPNGDCCQGLFSLKCYPGPQDPLLVCFSPQERDLVTSQHFDRSHTPSFEAQQALAEHLFNIGVLEVLLDPEDEDWILFTLEAPDIMRTRMTGANSDILRQVPAWRLAYTLFKVLLGMHAFKSRHRPARLLLRKGPGFELHEGAEADRRVVTETSDIELYTLSLLFCCDPSRPPSHALALMDRDQETGPERIILDQYFKCGHFHGPALFLEKSEVPAQQWWGLAQARYRSHLAGTCACRH